MKKILSMALTVVMLLSCMIVPTFADGPTDTFSITNYADDTTFTITTAADLKAFLATTKDYVGKTVILAENIDLTSETQALGIVNMRFQGTFDGNGKTITGMKLEGSNTGMLCAAMFPRAKNATIKNLTIDNFAVTNTYSDATADNNKNYTAALIGQNAGNVTIENCTVKNGTITTSATTTDPKMGVLIGGNFADQNTTNEKDNYTAILNTTVENVNMVYTGTGFTVDASANALQNAHKEGVGSLIGIYIVKKTKTTLDLNGTTVSDVTLNNNAVTDVVGSAGATDDGNNCAVVFTGYTYSQSVSLSSDSAKAATDTGTTSTFKTHTAAILALSDTISKYTVTWVIGDSQTQVEYFKDTTPTFSGTPEKAETATHLYRFKGWTTDGGTTVLTTLPTVTTAVTYTAVFEELEKVTVTWVTAKGTTTEVYAKGDVPSFKGDTSKDSTETSIYDFDDWDKELTALTEDTTFTAQYDETKLYIVTWKVDGQADVTEKYMEGQTPVWKNKKPAKAEDDEYTYTFTGWDKNLAPLTEDTVFTAIFEKTAKKTTAETTDNTTVDNTGGEKGGCASSVVLGSSLITVLGMVAASMVLRKKED